MNNSIKKRIISYSIAVGGLIICLFGYTIFHNQKIYSVSAEKAAYEKLYLDLRKFSAELEIWKGMWFQAGRTQDYVSYSELEVFRKEVLLPSLDTVSQNTLLYKMAGPSRYQKLQDSLGYWLFRSSDSLLNTFQREPEMPYLGDSIFYDAYVFSEIIYSVDNFYKNKRDRMTYLSEGIDQLALLMGRWAYQSKLRGENYDEVIAGYQYAFNWILSVLVILITLILLFMFRSVFQNFSENLDLLDKQLKKISSGQLIKPAATAQEFEEMEKHLLQLSRQMGSLKKLAIDVGKKNFSTEIKVFPDDSEVGYSLFQMRESLKAVAEEEENRNWLNNGLNEFSELLRNRSDNLQKLCDKAVEMMIKYVGGNQASLFLIEGEEADQRLVLKSLYANKRKKYLIKELQKGQSLVGECWAEGEMIHIKNVPTGYTEINSGLGDGTPKNILIMPLKSNDEINGVIEIASFSEISAMKVKFVQEASENLSSTISIVYVNENTRNLLEESNQITEQMKSQEEEMRQNMEELQATQEESARKSSEMEQLIADYKEREQFWEKEKANLNEAMKSLAEHTGADFTPEMKEKQDNLKQQLSHARNLLNTFIKA